MDSLFLKHKETYDGSQLSPLKNYLVHGLLGDSIVAWQGPCNVALEHMIDGEDLKVGAAIAGDEMLHFVLEVFHQSLHAGVFLQRLMGEMVRQEIREMGDLSVAKDLVRKGDDLYLGEKKLNVSIATCSTHSFLIHFGVNVTNSGTPVSTCSLEDFKVPGAEAFAHRLMEKVCAEVQSQIRGTLKVKTF